MLLFLWPDADLTQEQSVEVRLLTVDFLTL